MLTVPCDLVMQAGEREALEQLRTELTTLEDSLHQRDQSTTALHHEVLTLVAWDSSYLPTSSSLDVKLLLHSRSRRKSRSWQTARSDSMLASLS